MTLTPYVRHNHRLHMVTVGMGKEEAIAFAYRTREFKPILLRRNYGGTKALYHIIRELQPMEGLETFRPEIGWDTLYILRDDK